jgi:hypothetical protein
MRLTTLQHCNTAALQHGPPTLALVHMALGLRAAGTSAKVASQKKTFLKIDCAGEATSLYTHGHENYSAAHFIQNKILIFFEVPEHVDRTQVRREALPCSGMRNELLPSTRQKSEVSKNSKL